MADPDDILKRYGPADPRWLTPEDLADRKLHPASVNQFALPPKESRHVVTNDSTRPDAYVDKNVREFMPPTMFAGSYGLGRTLGTAYGDLRMGDYSAAAHALPEIAMAMAPMPGAKRSKLPMDKASKTERASAGHWEPDKTWYHGGNRIDRFLEKGEIDPRRASSGPMPFFTDDPQIASNYATGKPDVSRIDHGRVSDYFTVSPRDMGFRGRAPYTVEQTWHFLKPEQRALIADRAKRIGYENIDQADGPLVLHPEGVIAAPSGDHYDWVLKNEARGNHLHALREMWHDSGNLIGDEWELANIYKMAGYPFPISQYNAPWTTAPGVFAANLRMINPLKTADVEALKTRVLPALEEAFKRDRSRKKEFGADDWDKNTRWTPREWTQQLREDIDAGRNGYVWTSIPDKVTDVLKRLGYDAILDQGGKMGGTGHEVAIPFYPRQVRSKYSAKFDPAQLDSKKLLAAISGTAAPLTTADILARYGQEYDD